MHEFTIDVRAKKQRSSSGLPILSQVLQTGRTWCAISFKVSFWKTKNKRSAGRPLPVLSSQILPEVNCDASHNDQPTLRSLAVHREVIDEERKNVSRHSTLALKNTLEKIFGITRDSSSHTTGLKALLGIQSVTTLPAIPYALVCEILQ